MNKKSQITIFLLLAVILIVSFGFLFYARSRLINANEDPDSSIQMIPIKVYVESCLDKAADQALYTAGRQGGVIYNSQVANTKVCMSPPRRDYALAVIPVKESGIIWNVSYGIGVPLLSAPDYPYPGSLNPNDETSGLGINLYRDIALCNSTGQNSYDLPGAEYSCVEYAGRRSRHSIQDYLEKYIENLTMECVDEQIIKDYSGFDIIEGEIDTQVLFGERDVLIRSEYNIQVKSGENEESELGDFSLRKNIRFKKIYELAYFISEEEVNNVFFDMTNQTQLEEVETCPVIHPDGTQDYQKCLLEGMKLEVVKDPCADWGLVTESKHSDLVVITDSKSQLYGENFTFQFGVKNRAPALDFIDKDVEEGTPYYRMLRNTYHVSPTDIYSCLTTSANVNLCGTVEHPLKIYPYAVDPDGDEVTYNITGWLTPHAVNIPGVGYRGGGSSLLWMTLDSGAYLLNTIPVESLFSSPYRYIRVSATDGEKSDYQDIHILVLPGTRDSDGDGYANDVDNCPHMYNPDQVNSDGDDWGDECDRHRDDENAW